MDEAKTTRGYKVFDPDWVCRRKQYKCPGMFEGDVTPSVCMERMHFCRNVADCFNYYDFDSDNHVAEVIAHGEVAESGNKCCTDKLEIVREIPWEEVLKIVNSGKGCTGIGNSGNRNSGDWNSGNCNSGNRNSGDWNKSSFSNGCFNTKQQKIYLFNKPSAWTFKDWIHSEARTVLNRMPERGAQWIGTEQMTKEEKTAHPEHETTGGYLKSDDKAVDAQGWWDNLTEGDRETVRSLPNFDKDIFREITGINAETERNEVSGRNYIQTEKAGCAVHKEAD